MKEKIAFLFFITFFSALYKSDSPKRVSLVNMRYLKKTNKNRIHDQRKLLENDFRFNPLVFDLESVDSLNEKQYKTTTVQDLLFHFQNSKDSSQHLGFMIKNVETSLQDIKDNVSERISNVNEFMTSTIWKH